MDRLSQVLESPVLTAVSIVLAVIGIVLAYFFYRRGRRTKEACWAIRTNNLVAGYGSKLGDLEVLYKGQKVENLSISRIAFWNEGAETIDRQNLVTANPLRITTKGEVKLLDIKRLAVNNEASGFAVSLENDMGSARIEFDYLDREHGAVLQVVHTGKRSEDLDLVGAIKGVETLQCRQVQFTKYLPLPTPASFDKKVKAITRRRVRALVYILVGIAILSSYIWMGLGSSHRDWWVVVVGVALALPLLWMGLRYLSRQVPKGLEIIEEDILS
jgi:hypothetical protein